MLIAMQATHHISKLEVATTGDGYERVLGIIVVDCASLYPILFSCLSCSISWSSPLSALLRTTCYVFEWGLTRVLASNDRCWSGAQQLQ